MAIENFPEENIREILTYLPELQAMNIISGIQPSKQVQDMLIAFDRLGFVKTGFNYEEWLRSLPEGFATDIRVLEYADFDTVRNLITANIRINRFVGGYLDALLVRGYFHRILLRINELYVS